MDNIDCVQSKKYVYPVTDMPVGIISLSAYIKKHVDVEVKLIDFNVELNKIKDFEDDSFLNMYVNTLINEPDDYDVIGISCLFSTMYSNMVDIANIVKSSFRNSIIIAGGGIPTNAYKKIFKETNAFDALCFGEGEKPLLELFKVENKIEFLESNSSWITREKIKNNEIYKYDFINDLDEIPFYDYDLLDIESYISKPTPQSYFKGRNNVRLFYYLTSRGCPHFCNFCASGTVHGRKMRFHSVDRVKNDFNILKKKYNAEVISFQDDHLMSKKGRVEDFLNYAKEINLKLFFQTGVTLKSLDRKMLETLKDHGFTDLVLPMESGSERVLRDIIHKPADLTMARQVAKDCRDLDIFTTANIIIGLPGETRQDIEDTKQFLKSIDVNWFKFLIATPLIGSEFFKICVEKNYLDEDFIGGDFKNAVVDTEEFTKEEIEQLVYDLNLEINFVENSDMRLNNFEKAFERFKGVIKVKNDHAFAYYFAAKCCEKLNLKDEYLYYKNNYENIIANSFFWAEYALTFDLENLN